MFIGPINLSHLIISGRSFQTLLCVSFGERGNTGREVLAETRRHHILAACHLFFISLETVTYCFMSRQRNTATMFTCSGITESWESEEGSDITTYRRPGEKATD